jgi:HAD superfamily hydrolase (TIGR01509 family)
MVSEPIALVIFDCDGVLVDSEVIAQRVDAQYLTEAGFPITPEELSRRFVGKSAQAISDELAAQFNRRPADDFDKLRRARVMAALGAELRPMPGVLEALREIRFPRCVASSSHPERISLALRTVGLDGFFRDQIFSATMVARGKPAPDLFLYAAEKMGAHPSACLVIEDSTFGVQAAKAAQMRVFGFAGASHCRDGHADLLHRAGAERVLKSMTELPALLQPP